MEGVLLPLGLLFLLELDELAPFVIVRDSWVEDIGLGDLLAVEVVVLGGKSHFGLAEDERLGLVLLTPFSCREMARKGRELFKKLSYGVDGGLPHNCFEQDGFHPPFFRFGDGSHGFRDRRHFCAVCDQKGLI